MKCQLSNKAITCGITKSNESLYYSLSELEQLAKTANLNIVESFYQTRQSAHPKTYIGFGKIKQIKAFIDEHHIDVFIADDELSPLQYRLLGLEFGIKILDRTSLVLDIFAKRAKTHEAKLQIEYAQLAYLKPRLTRLWTHLSRLGGGIGTKGPGETQLEVDKRQINKRLSVLKKGIQKVQKTRTLYHNNRQRNKVLRAALIGYTNSGKSTFLNTLTQSSVLSENKLFATLDPTTRKFWVSQNQEILITDTVGFINKLPHQLIDAFKSTLEETTHADMIFHLFDASSPILDKHLQVAKKLIEHLNLKQKPCLMIANKIDCVEDISALNRVIQNYKHVLFTSANNRKQIPFIRQRIVSFISHYFSSYSENTSSLLYSDHQAIG